MNDRDVSIIGASSRLVGRVAGNGALRIDGSVRGEVAVGGDVELSVGAKVEGQLEGESLLVAGTLDGDGLANGPIRVLASATVSGSLKGSQVSIEPGAAVAVRLDADFELDI